MGEVLALGSAVVWALTSIGMRPLTGPLLLPASVVRMAAGTAVLLLLAALNGGWQRVLAAPLEVWLILSMSTVLSLVVGDSSFFASTGRLGVARALPVATSFPLLTSIGAVVFLAEPPTWRMGLGTLLVVAGVIVLAREKVPGNGKRDLLGYGLAITAAVTWATSSIFLGRAVTVVDPEVVNTIRFPLGTLVFSGLLLVRPPRKWLTRRETGLSLIVGVASVASALLYIGGMSMIGVARGVALNATSPVFAALLAAWLLHEPITRRTLLAVGITVAGTILLSVPA